MDDRHSRREFLRDTGTLTLGFLIGGTLVPLTPAEARTRDAPFRALDAKQVRTLEAFAEVLLPGSAAAGVAHFIDHQLTAPATEQMLAVKYLGVERPFQPFYAAGLAALDASARTAHGADFADLDPAQQAELTALAARDIPEGWNGPPAPLFYFVVRNDALDVVYGTQAGVESLGLPYMAHIVPPSRWGEA